MIKTMEVSPECCTTSNVVTISEYLFLRLNDTNAELKADNARLRSALRAIFDAGDAAVDEIDWGDRVSAAMTDERRALVT